MNLEGRMVGSCRERDVMVKDKVTLAAGERGCVGGAGR